MNNKLNTSDLRKIIAQRTGATEKEVAQFLTSLTAEIIGGLKSDDSVRINGLGTFRRQAVAPRKSVNVTTGEAMTIEGYHKLAFNPDAATKELLQNSTAAPAPQEESTPLQKLSVQADEIVGIIGELNHMDNQPAEQFAPAEEAIPTDTQSTEPETPEAETQQHPYYPPSEPQEEPKEEEKKENYHPLRDGLITIFIIILLLVIAFFFLKHSLVDFANGIAERLHNTDTAVESVTDEPAPVVEETAVEAIPAEEPATEEVVQETATEELPAEDTQIEEAMAQEVPVAEAPVKADTEQSKQHKPERTYKTMTIEYIHPNNSLSSLARQYYGETDCWVFIYEANKDKLKSPHSIAAWTEIRIPQIPVEWTNMSNPETRRMVDEMIQLYD